MTVREAAGDSAAAKGRWRRRLVVLAALLSAVLAVVAFRAHRHVRHDARFCAEGCHVPKDGAPSWHTTGHPETECQSCHTSDARTSYTLLWKKLTSQKDLPQHGKPDAAACTNCHDKEPAEWRLVSATEGHRTHRGVKDVSCLSCHAQNAHDKAPQTEKLCLSCHQPARLHKITADAETCISCHAFAPSARRAGKPRATACGGCHSDPTKVSATSTKIVDDGAVHGNLDCKLCHDPHGHARKVPEGQPICSRCHQVQVPDTEKKAGPEGHKDCAGCHEPHAQHKHALDSCVKCHETRVKGFAGAVNPLSPNGRTKSSALRHESCASCHLPHTWKAELSGCPNCHKDQAESIRTKSPEKHGACANCHDVHGPPPSGLVCLKCHSDTKQDHVAKAPGRHKDCTSCHEPHAATRSAARDSCGGCHVTPASQLVLGGASGHAKKGCLGCHTPHDSPAPPADLCSRCHAEKSKLAAAAEPAKHRACSSCHQSHEFAIQDVASACSKCHARQASNAKTWLATSAHAGPCQGCHQPHDVRSRKTCTDCHAKEAANAAGAKHRCSQCHAPHQAAPGAGSAWWGVCANCHAKQSAGMKDNGPQHSQCKSCHTTHRFEVPTCQSCHGTMTEKALHAAKGHAQKCDACHDPHVIKVEPSRTQCLACHTDKQQHEPTAQKCQACHPFR